MAFLDDINWKSIGKDLLGAVQDVGWEASKYYTSSYSRASEKIEYVTPLERVGNCMRRAIAPTRYYGANNPYATVDIENNGRMSTNNLRDAVETNSVDKPIHDKEWSNISFNFLVQDGK